MTPRPCPFCAPDPERIFLEGELVLALWDAFPLNPGHALIIPRRHVASWFEATAAEQAAGQTVDHLHVHVMPRYPGDVPDPTGGVRHVIPSRGDYPRGGDRDRWDILEELLKYMGLSRGTDSEILSSLFTLGVDLV